MSTGMSPIKISCMNSHSVKIWFHQPLLHHVIGTHTLGIQGGAETHRHAALYAITGTTEAANGTENAPAVAVGARNAQVAASETLGGYAGQGEHPVTEMESHGDWEKEIG